MQIPSLTDEKEGNGVFQVSHEIQGNSTIENLSLSIESLYERPTTYPVALRSNLSTALGTIQSVERNDKGVLEDFFYDHLSFRLKENLKNDLRITLPSGSFIPDFSYVNESKSVFILVEIDEPYSIDINGNYIPTHYKGVDDARNRNMLDCGWSVIRFSEQQIAMAPKDCEKFILDFIASIASTVLKKQPCWNFEEAQNMINEKFRNTYLPFDFQGKIKHNNNSSYRHFEASVIRGITAKKDGEEWVVIQLEFNKRSLEHGGYEYDPLDCYIPESQFWNRAKELKIDGLLMKKKTVHLNCRYQIYIPNIIFEGYGLLINRSFRLSDSRKFNLSIT